MPPAGANEYFSHFHSIEQCLLAVVNCGYIPNELLRSLIRFRAERNKRLLSLFIVETDNLHSNYIKESSD